MLYVFTLQCCPTEGLKQVIGAGCLRRRRLAGLRREEVLSQRYRVLDGPETDASTVQQLWLAVHDSREITVELVCMISPPVGASRKRVTRRCHTRLAGGPHELPQPLTLDHSPLN